MIKLIYFVIFSFVMAWSLPAQSLPTPSQAEGPYYPVEKPEDRDWNLVHVMGRSRRAVGTILELTGTVKSRTGDPLSGLTVEIWQTDSEGRYLHPNAPGTNRRDRNFQFYGEAVTDSRGEYQFRTILPQIYGSRPRHIHVKVRTSAGKELLTTQFYFPDDLRVQTDSLARSINDRIQYLMVEITENNSINGKEVLAGTRDIVLQ